MENGSNMIALFRPARMFRLKNFDQCLVKREKKTMVLSCSPNVIARLFSVVLVPRRSFPHDFSPLDSPSELL